MNIDMLEVKRIEKKQAKAIVENKHYSKRLGIFWEGFGLFCNGVIVGVCCYGQPSAPIQKYAFADRDFRLYELTRLVVDSNVKNGASYLISHSLKMLKEKPSAIISYADSSYGHCGIVYQATNWVYTGGVKAHDCLYLVGNEKMHPMTIRDKFNVTKIAEWAKENNIEKIKPLIKHRYFYFIGDKRQQKIMKSKLRYKIENEYPKTNKTTYDSFGCCCDY